MKAILTSILICLSILLFGQTKEYSIRWQKLAEQRIAAGKDSVYQQLLRAKQPENYLNPHSLSYSSAPYFTEASKQLLLEVLKDDWITEEQKREEAYKQVWQVVNQQINTCEDLVGDTIKYRGLKKKRKHFQTLLDSLLMLKQLNVDRVTSFQSAVERWTHDINQRHMPNLYIYTAGMLDDDRYIPILKKMLQDTIKYDSYAVKMSLARNDIGVYAEEMLEKNRIETEWFKKDKFDSDLRFYEYDIAAPNLFYLCSQEAIREYSKLLKLEFFKCIHNYDYDICSVPARVVLSLRNIILNKNFRNNLAQLKIYDIKKKHIKWTQNWLEKNYGNYELDRNFYPGLR